MMLLSKELLSEVLNTSIDKAYKVSDNIIIVDSIDGYQNINIYELQHKMKEWAFKQGYELQSRLMSNDHIGIGNCLVIRAESDPDEVKKIFNSDSEQQSVFDACQWILDNKDKQC